MKLAALAGVALLTFGSAAHATDFIVPLTQSGDTWTANYGTQGLTGLFSDTFTFTPDIPASLGDVTFTQIGLNLKDINVSALSIDGIDLMPFLMTSPGLNQLLVGGLQLASGAHVVAVAGEAGGNASYSGTVNFQVIPVPTPASWLLMLTGITFVGAALRAHTRRYRVNFA